MKINKKVFSTFTAVMLVCNIAPASAVGNGNVDFSGMLTNLESLINECNEKGIPTDYEKITYKVIERFETYINEDIQDGRPDSMTEFNISKINEMYREATDSLEGYLSGESVYFNVPDIDMTNLRKEGSAFYDGETPVISVGYGFFETAVEDMPLFNEFGAGNIQLETGPAYVMKNKSWHFEKSGNPDVTWEFVSEDVPEGNSALKISYRGGAEDNVFFSMYQTVQVVPGRKYVLTGKRKADSTMSDTWVSVNNYENRNYVSSQSGWRDFTIKYTIPEGVTTTNVRVMVGSEAEGFYLDDLCFAEEGSSENLLVNPGFENKDMPEYVFDSDSVYLKKLVENLRTARDNNLAVSLLLSPHYFPDNLPEDVYFDSGAFIDFNIGDERVREVIENYLRGILPLVAEYKDCIHNISISNEPGFASYTFHDFYLPLFRDYLEKKHGSIENLNRAYKSGYKSFDEIDMPDGISGSNSIWNAMNENSEVYYDWIEFNEEIFTNWHSWMADIVREYIPDKPINSKLLETFLDSSEETYYYGRMIQGADVEMFDTFSDISGCDALTYADDVDSYYTTMFYYDYFRSVTGKPIINTEDHVIRDKTSEYSDLYSAHVGNYLWMGAVHGRSMSTLWLWDRNYGDEESFEGSILYRPDVVSNVGKTSLDLTRLSGEITDLRNSSLDVAIYCSKPSRYYSKDYADKLLMAYKAVLATGKSAGVVTDMSADRISDYKVLIIPGAVYTKENTINKIKEFVNNGGLVIYCGNVLSANEYRLPLDNSLIKEKGTEYTSDSVNSVKNQFTELFRKSGILDAVLIDESTGKYADGVDWQYTVNDNGELLVNVSNMDYGTVKNLSLYYKNRKMNGMLELISGERGVDTIKAEGYVPQLLLFRDSEPGIKNVRYDENKNCITWEAVDSRGTSVTIYKIKGDGTMAVMAKTANNIYIPEGDGCYAVKADGGNTETVTVGGRAEYTAEVTDVKVSGGCVSCTVKITNTSDSFICGEYVLRYGTGENDKGEFSITLKSGETKEFSFSSPAEAPGEIYVEKVS